MRILYVLLASAIICICAGCDLLFPQEETPEDSSKTINLTVNVSTSADVIAEMEAEPVEYYWNDTVYTKDDLPVGPYLMKYGSSDTYTTLAFVIINNGQEHILNEARIEKAGTNYSCLNGSLRIGTTLEDALIALGAP